MFKNNSGQIIIVFLGLMGLALGLGLSMAKRAVVGIKSGSQSELSTKAYYAAEAGGEKALGNPDILTDCPASAPCTETLNDCEVSYYAEAATDLALSLGKDRLFSISTTGSLAGGYINFAWNRSGSPNGIEVIEVYGPVTALQSRKLAYSCGRTETGFASNPGGVSGDYNCSTGNIFFSANTQKIIVKMLFAGGTPSGDITYTSSGLVSNQGVTIYSTGTCNDIQRRIRITKPLNGSGSDFSFGLFAPFGDLDMN